MAGRSPRSSARDNIAGTQFHPGEEPAARARADRQFPEVEAVILFPAIDLKDGVCVRLEQGDMARATVFNRDPAAQAHAFETQGFEYLHVVDLDGAFAGKPVNAARGRAHPRRGRRSRCSSAAASATWRRSRAGSARASTASSSAPRRCAIPSSCRTRREQFPGRVAVGLDARDGKVAVEGWAETSELTALDIARRFEDAGVAAIIYTDIARDGMLQGPQPRRHASRSPRRSRSR